MANMKGKLFIISGPSGVGKDTVIEKAKALGLDFGRVITTTTRNPRKGEKEGNPYHFINQQEFQKLIKEKKLLEWAKVYDNYYGSTRQEVDEALEQNKIVVFKVDPQGARTIKKMIPKAEVIFLVPPSVEALAKRLKDRQTDSEPIIKKRLSVAKKEMNQLQQWDHIVINEEGKLKQAALRIKRIIEGSSKKKLLRIILFSALSLTVVISYLIFAAYLHPQTNASVKNYIQKVATYLEVNGRIKQSQTILSFLPSTAQEAYLIGSVEIGKTELNFPILSFTDASVWPSLEETLIIYHTEGWRMGIVGKLAYPVEENWASLQEAIKYIWSLKYPSQITKTLADGTETVELVPQPEKVEIETIDYQEAQVMILDSEQGGIAFSKIDDYIVLANYNALQASAQGIHKIIDAYQNSNQKLKLDNFTICAENSPYKLTLYRKSGEESHFLANDPLYRLIFGQNKPKMKECL